MRTNQVLVREDNRFIQRTSDGYFNASALINSIEGTSRSTRKYKSNKSTVEFIDQLKKEGIDKPYISSNKGVWMHPKLFVDFAMYVSVEFKSVVIDYVLDGLIKSRNDAGDYYNQMCATIMQTHIDYYGTKPNPKLYINEAKRIKELLGTDKPRNELSELELNNITQMQKLNSLLLRDNVGKESRIKQLKQQARLLNMV